MSLISSSRSPDLPDPAATREGERGDVIAIADMATVAQGLLGTLLAGYGRLSDPLAPTCSAQVEGRGLLLRWVAGGGELTSGVCQASLGLCRQARAQ